MDTDDDAIIMDTDLSPVAQFPHELEANQEVLQEGRRVTVQAEGLKKYFKNQGETIKAVDGVSFAFTEGQFIAITGSSGCGKSTLLYLLGGLDKATAGELVIDGVDV